VAGREATFALGGDAARMFYEAGRMTRRGALPPAALLLLQDRGSVATLDGDAHRHRKAMFLSVLAPEQSQRLAAEVREAWRSQLPRWQRMGRVVLLDEAHAVLCRAVCEWAGIPLGGREASARTRELAAMVDGAGAVGPRNWRGMLLRARTERWARRLVRAVRAGELDVAVDSPLAAVAWHRELDGQLLDVKVAGVELLNVIRPTVAVARYVVFAALALHEHPEHEDVLRGGGDDAVERFVQEVRRSSPFFPMVAGRAQEPFEWRGHRFPERAWVLLDLYATNHDPRLWDRPERFDPERFRDWRGDPYSLVPQGGGDHATGHRCAGEWATVEVMKAAVGELLAMRYEVPEQDLRVELSRMPAKPRSGMVLTNVRPASA
jgi:fatty-acid peroxygenase